MLLAFFLLSSVARSDFCCLILSSIHIFYVTMRSLLCRWTLCSISFSFSPPLFGRSSRKWAFALTARIVHEHHDHQMHDFLSREKSRGRKTIVCKKNNNRKKNQVNNAKDGDGGSSSGGDGRSHVNSTIFNKVGENDLFGNKEQSNINMWEE